MFFRKSSAVELPIANIVSAWKGDGNTNDSVDGNSPVSTENITYVEGLGGRQAIHYFNAAIISSMTVADNDNLSFAGVGVDLPFSGSLLCRRNNNGNAYNFFHKGTNVFPNEYTMWTQATAYLEIELRDNTSGNWIKATSVSPVPNSGFPEPDLWQHYIWTYNGDRTPTGLKVYYNGIEQACTYTSSGVFSGLKNLGAPLTIGRRPGHAAYSAKAYVQDQYLWNVCLTPEQCLELATQQKAGIDLLP